MDLLLANAYFLSLDAEEQRVMRPHPPLGLLYLSSHLKSRGIDVGVFDGTFRSLEAISPIRSSASGLPWSALPST